MCLCVCVCLCVLVCACVCAFARELFGSELDCSAFIEGTSLLPHKTRGVRKTKNHIIIAINKIVATCITRQSVVFIFFMHRNSAICWSYFMPAIGVHQKHGPSYVIIVTEILFQTVLRGRSGSRKQRKQGERDEGREEEETGKERYWRASKSFR